MDIVTTAKFAAGALLMGSIFALAWTGKIPVTDYEALASAALGAFGYHGAASAAVGVTKP